jgi:hypothetical protein
VKTIRRARRTGAELIQAGQFAEAVRFLHRATADHPEDAELHRLLAAAALDRAIERDNEVETALARLFLVRRIRATLSSPLGSALKDDAGTVSVAVADAHRNYQSSLLSRGEVHSLLEEAVKAAAVAIQKEGPASPAIMVAVWTDAYRIIQADSARSFGLRFDQIQTEGGPPAPPTLTGKSLAGEPAFDRPAVRRHALHLLAGMARVQPDSPLPYLAAAEWMQLVEQRFDPEDKLSWQRNWRFRDGIPDGGPRLSEQAAREEYETERRTPVDSLDAVGVAQIAALYERAAQLDPKDDYGTAYALYVQVLPCDPDRAKPLLARQALREPGNALIPLEEARQAAANGDPDGMLRLLERATAASRLHRPLVNSLPGEISQPFLSAHLVWKSLSETGFGFNYIQRVILSLFRTRQSPAEREPLHLLKARLGALLMQSDLPHDWALGAELRRDALGALARDPDLPPSLAAQVRGDLQRVQAQIAARPLPLQMGILTPSRLLLESAIGDDLMITGPCIIAEREGGVMVGD